MHAHTFNVSVSLSIVIAVSLLAIGCGEAVQSESIPPTVLDTQSLTATQDAIHDLLAQPVWTLEITEADLTEDEIAAITVDVPGGSVVLELEWLEPELLADGPYEITFTFAGVDAYVGLESLESESLVEMDLDGAVEHLLAEGVRPICGVRRLVAEVGIEMQDGWSEVRMAGLGFVSDADAELLIADLNAEMSGGVSSEGTATVGRALRVSESLAEASSGGCPLNHRSKKCKNHTACTIQLGIFTVDGQCWPQWPAGWPCLCDPLYDLY